MRRVCGGSYQWDVQATVLRVAKSMRERGFRVWMDTEMMSGSTLDAMAAAVEGAHCVLICITERYKVRACDVMTTCQPLHRSAAGLPLHRSPAAIGAAGAGQRQLPARGHMCVLVRPHRLSLGDASAAE